MATPQPGIFAQGTRSHRHLEFELLPDVTTEATLAALRGLRQPSATAGDANIVIGFSPALWRRIAPGVAPAALTEFPDLDGVPSTEHDIWVWIHGTGDDELLDISRAVAGLLQPVAAVAQEVAGFAYHDSRDLTGFIDGTENPVLEEAFTVATIADGNPVPAARSPSPSVGCTTWRPSSVYQCPSRRVCSGARRRTVWNLPTTSNRRRPTSSGW